MDIGGVGPITSLVESTAAAVGASMLLGGFVVGIHGLVSSWPRPMLERRALDGGYFGGAFGLAGFVADIIIRYVL
jgi:hypothetical protein